MKTFLNILKWVSIYAAFLIISMIVAVYFLAVDPNDAPLWAAIVMGWLGLAVGAVVQYLTVRAWFIKTYGQK